jgi:GAF domain-containing protein
LKKPLGKLRRFGLLGGLLVLFTALFAGEQMISGGDPSLELHGSATPATTSSVVEQSPLRTARELASQAAVAQEQQYAEQALRLADTEVDQDFAGALRSATSHAPPPDRRSAAYLAASECTERPHPAGTGSACHAQSEGRPGRLAVAARTGAARP